MHVLDEVVGRPRRAGRLVDARTDERDGAGRRPMAAGGARASEGPDGDRPALDGGELEAPPRLGGGQLPEGDEYASQGVVNPHTVGIDLEMGHEVEGPGDQAQPHREKPGMPEIFQARLRQLDDEQRGPQGRQADRGDVLG